MAFAQYENVLDPSNTLREPDLHAPFRAIASKLVLDAHIVLGILDANLVEHFWDGNGTTILSSKYTKQKPDLLSLWGPVPNWAKTRSALEFRIEMIPNNAESSVSLPVISEDLFLPKPDRTPPRQPQEISLNRRVKKQKDPGRHSRAATISTERTSRISSADSGPSRFDHNSSITSGTQSLKRRRSVEDDDDTVSVASALKRSRYAANYITQDQLQLATYALECLSVSS